MRKILFLFLVIIFFLSAYAIDKKERGANVTKPNKTADSVLAEADSIFQKRDYKSALDKYLETVDSSLKEFNPSVEIEALSQVARMNLILGNKNEGESYLLQAESKVRDSDPYGYSRFLSVKGRFEWKDNDLSSARKTFEKMYEFCTSNSLWGRAVDAAHMIAIVADNFEDQVSWGKLGIEAANANDKENWLGPLWNNLGGTYYDKNKYDSALVCYLNAREYHWRFGGETAKLFADYHVGMIYRLLNDYDNALKWLRPVLAWAERLENHSAIGQTCEDLGEIDAAKGNKISALKFFKRAKEEYIKAGFDKSWAFLIENIDKRIKAME